jgi:hypothetical protein
MMEISIVECGEYRVVVWLHTTEDPSAELWAAALQKIAVVTEELGDLSKLFSFALTDGGAPNAEQRRSLFTELLKGEVKSAVVTTVLSNPIKRGIATALLWLNPNFRAFSPLQFSQALDHLGLQKYKSELLDSFDKMQAELPPIMTLRLAKGAGESSKHD